MKRPIDSGEIPPRLTESFTRAFGKFLSPAPRVKNAGQVSAKSGPTTDLLPPALNKLVSDRLLARAQRESMQETRLPDKVMETSILDEYLSMFSDAEPSLKDREKLSLIIEALLEHTQETLQISLSDLTEKWSLTGRAPNLVALRSGAAGILVGRKPTVPRSVTAFWSHAGQSDSEPGVALPDDQEAAFLLPKCGKHPLWNGRPIRLIIDYQRRASITVDVLPS